MTKFDVSEKGMRGGLVKKGTNEPQKLKYTEQLERMVCALHYEDKSENLNQRT